MTDREPVLNKHILYKAVMAFYQQVGMRFSLEKGVGEQLSGTPRLRLEGRGLYTAYVRNWVPQAHEASLIESVEALSEPLLIADYINPQLAERLRTRKIPFIDTTGNLYLSADALYLFVKGNKPKKREGPELSRVEGRAFTAIGLQLVYYLLTDPSSIKLSYRQLAAMASISVGSIGPILQDLKNHGFLIEHGEASAGQGAKKKVVRELVDLPILAKKWSECYSDVLKERRRVARFMVGDWSALQRLPLNELEGCWGGSQQASLQASGVESGVPSDLKEKSRGTLYLKRGKDLTSLKQISSELNLESSPVGELEVVEAFWPLNRDTMPHPLITYSDMLGEGIDKNSAMLQAVWQEVTMKLKSLSN